MAILGGVMKYKVKLLTVFNSKLHIYGGDGAVLDGSCGASGRARLFTVRRGLARSTAMRVFAGRPIAFALLKVETESHLIWGRAYRGAGARPRTARGLSILPC